MRHFPWSVIIIRAYVIMFYNVLSACVLVLQLLLCWSYGDTKWSLRHDTLYVFGKVATFFTNSSKSCHLRALVLVDWTTFRSPWNVVFSQNVCKVRPHCLLVLSVFSPASSSCSDVIVDGRCLVWDSCLWFAELEPFTVRRTYTICYLNMVLGDAAAKHFE